MDPRKKVRDLIGRIDEKIAAQLQPILDHPEFRALDRAWRSLHYVVAHSETGEDLRIEFMSVTKEEVCEELVEFHGGHWEKNGLFKHLHDMVYGGFGGEPFGLVVLDHDLDADDADLMDALDRLGETVHVPILAGAEDAHVQGHVHLSMPPALNGVGSAHVLAWRIGKAFARTGWYPESELVGTSGVPGPAGLPGLLAACRFAQYLKCVYRDRMGRTGDRDAAEENLAEWLSGYVAEGEPTAERPLAAASVTVEYDLEDEQRHRFRLRVRPAYEIDPVDRVVVGRFGI